MEIKWREGYNCGKKVKTEEEYKRMEWGEYSEKNRSGSGRILRKELIRE